jgi:hypothetical protein
MKTALSYSIFIGLALSGCATPYNRSGMGLTGGVEAQMITNDTARISARGNGYTDRARITDFVLLKSAETALAGGFTHFIILNAADASRTASDRYAGLDHNECVRQYGDINIQPWRSRNFHKARPRRAGKILHRRQGEVRGSACERDPSKSWPSLYS